MAAERRGSRRKSTANRRQSAAKTKAKSKAKPKAKAKDKGKAGGRRRDSAIESGDGEAEAKVPKPSAALSLFPTAPAAAESAPPAEPATGNPLSAEESESVESKPRVKSAAASLFASVAIATVEGDGDDWDSTDSDSAHSGDSEPTGTSSTVMTDLPLEAFSGLVRSICKETGVKPLPSTSDLKAAFIKADEDQSGTGQLFGERGLVETTF